MKKLSKRLVSIFLTVVLVLGMVLEMPGLTLTVKADTGATTISASQGGASDGVIYVLERKMAPSDFEVGKMYMFVAGGARGLYLTSIPKGTGILKIASPDRETRGGWYPYLSKSVTAYVDVIRGTEGFDLCPHGTLNYSASEYNCWMGGVQHEAGAAYYYKEMPYGSKVTVTITKEGHPWTDAKVALYLSGKKLQEISSATGGKYDFGYRANGRYQVYVNNDPVGEICVNACPKQEVVDAPGSVNADGFRYITDITYDLPLEYHTFTAKTNLTPGSVTGAKMVSSEPGEILLINEGRILTSGQGEASRVIMGPNDRLYSLHVGGTDTGHRLGKHETGEESDEVDFYKMKVTVNADRSFSDADVSLRNEKGELIYVMKYDQSLSSGNTAVFTAILQAEESAQGTEKSYDEATSYRVYVNGQDTHKIVKKVGWAEGMEEGFRPYEASVDFYTASLTVKKDNATWSQASAALDNGVEHYVMNYKASEQKYEAYVLKNINEEGEERPYTISVEGALDTGAPSTLTSTAKTAVYDYYTVEYYTYKKANANDTSYALDTSKPWRSQIVRKGCKTTAPSDAYVDGLSFRWYSRTKWSNGDAFPEFKYDENPINAKTTLYAQFAKPEVKVGEFVAAEGPTFKLENLTISGFDRGDKAIKSVQIQTKNTSKVKFNTTSGIIARQGTGQALSNNSEATSNIIDITFNNGLSMADAQTWLRNNLVFTPVTGKQCVVKITASDGVISSGETSNPSQSQVNNVTATELTGNNNDLSSGYYYLTQNRSYTDYNRYGALRIAAGATVRIYIPANVTLTATGSNANGQTGAGAGIFVPSSSTLILVGKGNVNAIGGNAANGASGSSNEKNASVKRSGSDNDNIHMYGGTGGAGGDGGGGAGAGIGGYGSNGGTGGAGGTGTDRKRGTGGEIVNGNQGGFGGDGSDGTSGGAVIIGTGLTVTAKGGAAGYGGSAGGWYTDESSLNGTNYRCHDSGSHSGDAHTGAAGGAGAGGGAGSAADDYGRGGVGGGGGGGGAGGGTARVGDNKRKWPDGSGGSGGYSAASDGKGVDGGGGTGYATGGGGGTNGRPGNPAQPVKNYTNGDSTKFTVTFTNANRTITYNYGFGASITNIPDYSAPAGYYFLGWKVTTYGKYMGRTSGIQPLTSAETKLYQPGDSVNITEGTYGNIVLSPITRKKVGICAEDERYMTFPTNYKAPTYYNYKLSTFLDGVATKEMGALILKSGNETLTMAPDASGNYAMKVSANKDYSVTSASYPEFGAMGVVSASGANANRRLDFSSMQVEVRGYDSCSVTLNASETDTAGPKLAQFSVTNPGKADSVSTFRHLIYGTSTETYDIYIDGTHSSFYGCDQKAAYGAGKKAVIIFCTNKVNINTNMVITRADLRELSGSRVKEDGEILSLIQSVDNNKVWSLRKPKAATSYEIYVNGVDTGVKADFDANHTADVSTGGSNIEASLYLLTVKTNIDGRPADVADVTIGDEAAARVETGVYRVYSITTGTRSVKVGDTNAGSVATSDTVENSTLTADFYTVKYWNSETDTGENNLYLTDKDPAIYYKGSQVTALDGSGALPNGYAVDPATGTGTSTPATADNSYFLGWKSGTDNKIYKPGEKVSNITAPLVFNSAWSLFSTAETRWVINGKTHYGTLDEALAAANDENTAAIDIYVQNPATLTATATLPESATLTVEPSRTLYEKTIDTNTGEETDSQTTIGDTNGGELNIAKGVVLSNYGSITNDTWFTVKAGGTLINKYVAANDKQTGAFLVNSGSGTIKTEPANGSVPQGRIINEGIFKNSGTTDLDPGSFENEGETDASIPGGELPYGNGGEAPLGGLGNIINDDPVVIRLEADADIKAPLVIDSAKFSGKKIVLDLNGHVLTGPADAVTDGDDAAVKVTGENTGLTIIDSVGGGSLQGGKGCTPSTGSGDGVTYQDGTEGNPGLEVAAGEVTIDASAKVYGGTGGTGVGSTNGGEGGLGAKLTGGKLIIENGGLVQGGNGGDVIADANDSSVTPGTGGKGGTGIAGMNGVLDNHGSASNSYDTSDGSGATVRPGKPGSSYKYTPPTVDNGGAVTPGSKSGETPGAAGSGIGSGVEQEGPDSRVALTAGKFTIDPGYVTYKESNGNAVSQEPEISFMASDESKHVLNGNNPSKITVIKEDNTNEEVPGAAQIGAVTIAYYAKNDDGTVSSTPLENSDKPAAVGTYVIKVTTTGSADKTSGYLPASALTIGTFTIVPAAGENPVSLDPGAGDTPKITPLPGEGGVTDKTYVVTVNNGSEEQITVKIDGDAVSYKKYAISEQDSMSSTVSLTVESGYVVKTVPENSGIEFTQDAGGQNTYSATLNVTGDTDVSVIAIPAPATVPVINKITGATLTEGYSETHNISVVATPTQGETLSYQWYKGEVSVNNKLESATTAEYGLPTGDGVGLTVVNADTQTIYTYNCVITSKRIDNEQTVSITVPVKVTILKATNTTEPDSCQPETPDTDITAPQIAYENGIATINHVNTGATQTDTGTGVVTTTSYELYYVALTGEDNEAATPAVAEGNVVASGWTKADAGSYTSDTLTLTTTYRAFVAKKVETTNNTDPDNPVTTQTYTLSKIVERICNVDKADENPDPDQPVNPSHSDPIEVAAPTIEFSSVASDGNSGTATITATATVPDGWTAKTYYTVNGTTPTASTETMFDGNTATVQLNRYTHVKAVTILTKDTETTKSSTVTVKTFIPKDVVNIAVDGSVTPLKPGTSSVTMKLPKEPGAGESQEDVGITFDVTEIDKAGGAMGEKDLSMSATYTVPYGFKGLSIAGATTSSDTNVATVGTGDDAGKITTVAISGTDTDGNPTVTNITNGTKILAGLIVVKRPITIAPNSNNITYDDEEPNYTYTVEGGLAEGDVLSGVEITRADGTGQGSYDLTIAETDRAAITIKNGETNKKDNYNISFGTGSTLVIAKRDVIVSGIKPVKKYYDGTKSARLLTSDDNVTLSGTRVVDNNTKKVLNHAVTIPAGQTFEYSSADAGTYKINLKNGEYYLYEVAGGSDNPAAGSQEYVESAILRYPLGGNTDTGALTLGQTTQTYNGRAQFPETVTATYPGSTETKTWNRGSEYVVNSSGYKNVGEYNVTINGRGNYTGSAAMTFKITPRELTGAMVTLAGGGNSLVYKGSELTQDITGVTMTVDENTLTLKEGVDYEIVDASNKVVNAGSHTIKLKGINNFTGTLEVPFTVNKISRNATGTRTYPLKVEVSPAFEYLTYDGGNELEQTFIVKLDGRVLGNDEYTIKNVKYTVNSGAAVDVAQTEGNGSAIKVKDIGTYTVDVDFTNYDPLYTAAEIFKVTGGKPFNELKITSNQENNVSVYDPGSSDDENKKTTLTAVTDVDNEADVSFSYQWYRDGEPIERGTTKDHTLSALDVGHVLKVEVTANGVKRSALTPTITAKPDNTGPEPSKHKVSGKVKKPDSAGDSPNMSPVAGITVELRKGNLVYATATTDADGNYSFDNLPDGEYNVVALAANEVTKTELAVLKGSDQVIDIHMPYYKVSSKLNVYGDTPPVVVGGLDNAAEESLTEGEKNAGATVTMTMTVQGKADLTEVEDSQLSEANRQLKEDQNAIKEKAGLTTPSEKQHIEFIDMSVSRRVEQSGSATTTEVHSELSSVLEIIVPYSTQNRRNFRIFRRHDTGNTDDAGNKLFDEVESFGQLSTRPTQGYTDGKFYLGVNFLVIYTAKCSTYAVAYEDYTPGGGGGGSTPKDTAEPVVTQPEHGEITLNPEKPGANEPVVITVTTEEGYETESITVTDKDGNPIEVTKNEDGTYTFVNPENGGVSITANILPVDAVKVTFDLNGKEGIAPDTQGVKKGEKAVRPTPDPVTDGYSFVGWFTDKECTNAYDFETPVEEDITLYAGWKKTGEEEDEDFGIYFVELFDDPYEGVHYNAAYNDGEGRFETVYTGAPIKPLIRVTSKADGVLKEGIDYSVSYSNNKNVSIKKPATIKVSGKGFYKSKKVLELYILPADLEEARDKGLLTGADELKVQSGSKLNPVLVYRGYKLSGSSRIISNTGKITEDTTTDIEGKKNFTGTLKDVPVKVMNKDDQKKGAIKVSLKAGNHTYNGQEQELSVTAADEAGNVTAGELTVTAGSSKTPLEEGTDFVVSYSNNKAAGKATVTIAGIGSYNGIVVKSFTIQPDKMTDITADLSGPEKAVYFNVRGAKPDVTIVAHRSTASGSGSDTASGTGAVTDEVLKEGKDYKVTYSSNKKVGDGAYTVKFLNNYKGHKDVKGSFKIVPAPIDSARVDAAQMIYKKSGKYLSKPYVSLDGVQLNNSDFTYKYYLGEEEITSKYKLSLADDETAKTVKIVVIGKGNYTNSTAEGTYEVVRRTADAIDLTKARIVAKDKNKRGRDVSVARQEYTGYEIEPEIRVMAKVNRKWVDVDPSLYTVSYINNLNKGSATILVTGDGENAIGSKTARFSISTMRFELFKLIFGK